MSEISARDMDEVKTNLINAIVKNVDTTEVLRSLQERLKVQGKEPDIEDIYNDYLRGSDLSHNASIHIRNDMGGGRDFKSEEVLILADENLLIDHILRLNNDASGEQTLNTVLSEEVLRKVMKSSRDFYGERIRKDGSLFYSHALKTAIIFLEHGKAITGDMAVVALMHDVVERGMTGKDTVLSELTMLGIKNADTVTDLLVGIAPAAKERKEIREGETTGYFERIGESLLPIVLAEKIQNIHDGRRLFLARPADERSYINARLKPLIVEQYLKFGIEVDLKIVLLANYIDLVYLTETYDKTLDDCVNVFLTSGVQVPANEKIGIVDRLNRLKSFMKHNDELNRILKKNNLTGDSASYACVRRAVTDTVQILTPDETDTLFTVDQSGISPVENAIRHFTEWAAAGNVCTVNNGNCAIHLNNIGYELNNEAELSKKLVEDEKRVAEILREIPRENGIEELKKTPGETIVHAGIVSEAVYLLLDGDAYFYFASDLGRKGGCLGRDNTISSTSVREQRPAMTTVKAGDNGATVLRIPGTVYKALYETNSELDMLLKKTSTLRKLARLRSLKTPIANLDLIQRNTMREIIDVQHGRCYGAYDTEGIRRERRVAFKRPGSNAIMSFADLDMRVKGLETDTLRTLENQQQFIRDIGADYLSFVSKLRGLLQENELVIEIDGQFLTGEDMADQWRVSKFMRQIEEMLTVETAHGREHRQAIDLVLYPDTRKGHLAPPAILKDMSDENLLLVTRNVSIAFIDDAIREGYLYAHDDPDNVAVKTFIATLIDLIGQNYAERIRTNEESFKKIIFTTIESMIIQQGGALLRENGTCWSFGTGANRLRGSNGVMHIIANWRRGKTLIEALRNSYRELEDYQALLCLAFAWHDANAGSIQEANTGTRFWVTRQSPDLKAGHGFAAVKYLEELRIDLEKIFGEKGFDLLEKIVAMHDNNWLKFGTAEEALLSIAGISDNSASEEKVIEAFTKVPGNERVAIELYEKFKSFKPKDINRIFEETDEEMVVIRSRMEENIVRAEASKIITTLQRQAFMNAINNDLTLNVGKGALEALGMDKSVSRATFRDGVLTIVHTRTPLYESLKTILGKNLLQSRIYDCVKEYRDFLPNLDEEADLAEQKLVCETGLTKTGKVQKVVFKIEDAPPSTEPLDYTRRIYNVLQAGRP